MLTGARITKALLGRLYPADRAGRFLKVPASRYFHFERRPGIQGANARLEGPQVRLSRPTWPVSAVAAPVLGLTLPKAAVWASKRDRVNRDLRNVATGGCAA